jgi:hypothetical protein
MEKYDLIITASCYYSPEHALRLIKSTPVIDGNVLTVITCPRMEDANSISGAIDLHKITSNAIILYTERKERHLCQDLGVLYCIANNISADYLMFADDDVEFRVDAPAVINHLDIAPKFSSFGFSSNWISYGSSMKGEEQHGEWIYNCTWLDGHNFTVNWEDIHEYGLFDQVPGYYNSSSVEVEIMHRYRVLSGLPSIGCTYSPIIHHSRIDEVEKTRDKVNNQNPIHCGLQLWEKKFGLSYGSGDFNSGKITWNDVYKVLSDESFLNSYKRHLILDGIWTDYDQAWERFGTGVHLIKRSYKE